MPRSLRHRTSVTGHIAFGIAFGIGWISLLLGTSGLWDHAQHGRAGGSMTDETQPGLSAREMAAEYATGTVFDITECAREPIHLLGSVQ